MDFLNFVFRYSTVNVFVLLLILSIHGFLLVKSQDEAQFPPPSPPSVVMQFGNSPPPPPPPSPSPPPPPPPPSPPPPTAPPPPPIPISPPPISNSPPPPQAKASPPRPNRNKPRRLHRPPPPPPPPPVRTFKQPQKRGLNTGKTVGLVFAVFAAVLQICVVAFLVYKRKQLLTTPHTY